MTAVAGAGAGVEVTNCTCGTVMTCVMTLVVAGVLSLLVMMMVLMTCIVVIGAGALPWLVGTGTGERVIVLGTLVQMPGFWGMKSAQTPAK